MEIERITSPEFLSACLEAIPVLPAKNNMKVFDVVVVDPNTKIAEPGALLSTKISLLDRVHESNRDIFAGYERSAGEVTNLNDFVAMGKKSISVDASVAVKGVVDCHIEFSSSTSRAICLVNLTTNSIKHC